jgi:RNA polymerase sigma-70 factor (ECF subfamily)
METETERIEPMIAAARQSDRAALAELLESFKTYLRLLARAWLASGLRGKADPSDLVQDTMLQACQRFAQFRGQTEAELAAWLRQILARNVAQLARRYRAAGRHAARERSLDELLARSNGMFGGLLAASGSSPSRAAERRDLGLALTDALAQLSDPHREVIVLRSLEQLEWGQVAQRMDRSVDAVRMLWLRALKQLRPLIEARL